MFQMELALLNVQVKNYFIMCKLRMQLKVRGVQRMKILSTTVNVYILHSDSAVFCILDLWTASEKRGPSRCRKQQDVNAEQAQRGMPEAFHVDQLKIRLINFIEFIG